MVVQKISNVGQIDRSIHMTLWVEAGEQDHFATTASGTIFFSIKLRSLWWWPWDLQNFCLYCNVNPAFNNQTLSYCLSENCLFVSRGSPFAWRIKSVLAEFPKKSWAPSTPWGCIRSLDHCLKTIQVQALYKEEYHACSSIGSCDPSWHALCTFSS